MLHFTPEDLKAHYIIVVVVIIVIIIPMLYRQGK